ncbi:aminoglycoside phosphotransferase [Mycolicibacterium madagascariense]|uniref:Aminoglycoside phosphotransferase n=1 Tax=Mycolicibacterium madagascariense TaxID=212765 RepID=A0A7I7XIH0_9MYCO|nr:aminoglycoside phosphotransferase family protein [Mycolicibacterium madagascariense]MCV7011091.1 aminoglycoside phosphotransferase family protein [Mycolicibacterium madagascariense]BBZ29011.1 aminoglycoside phosphotransferase [Mycolicibacterium madagascariense]
MSAPAIPRGPAEVTPRWLSTVLGVDVEDVRVTPIGTGQTGATYRLAVAYGRAPSELPATFAIKLSSQDEAVRDRVALGYRSEHAFYTGVADAVGVPIPRHYHCAVSDDGGDFVLLLADLAPAVQGDQIGGCTTAEAELAVRALAGLHGPTWCDAKWPTFPGLVMSTADADAMKGMGDVAAIAAQMTLDRLGDRMSAQDRATVTETMAAVTPWLVATQDRFALLHGDYRLDNVLFDPDRSSITVVDWQTLGVGLPTRDLAYFTGTSLLPAARLAADHDLVAAYHSELAAYGVEDYDLDTCLRDYRIGMVQVPLIAVLGCAFSVATERGDDMMLVMLERGCQAIRELDSLALVG